MCPSYWFLRTLYILRELCWSGFPRISRRYGYKRFLLRNWLMW
jgi:hypothetical protein